MTTILPRLLAAALFLAGLTACQRESTEATATTSAPVATSVVPASAAPAATAEFPSLRLPTVDGGTFDIVEHRGKWVVVNYWATWCGPCLKEMPELSALDAMREHIDVIGLAYEDTTPEAMRAFLEKHPVAYPIALVDVYAPPKDFEAPRGLPMTWLLAPDGKVARSFTGPVTAHDIEAAIAAAGGPAAAGPGSG